MNLAEIFGDHMVLQRNLPISIFGYGKGKGSIEFCGNVLDFESNEERFCVYLPAMSEGGPYEMKVNLNGKIIVIHDVMIGEVYLAAGQSNIAYPLSATYDIEYTNNPDIRFFTEPLDADQNAVEFRHSSDWMVCRGHEPDRFSAIGYYFAAELQRHIGVPVGIVSCSMGASRVDAWTVPEYQQTPEYQQMIKVRHRDYDENKFNHDSWCYKNKLLKIVPYTVSGVLWYQGESNRLHEEAVYYDKLLEIMIKNWRELWDRKLPFYCVQLMPFNEPEYGSDWALVRSQQEKVSKTVDNVYMVTLVDTGEAKAIHPLRKKKVSYALANAVRNIQFGENVEYSGPVLESARKYSDHIELEFSHADGLYVKEDFLYDTYIYGEGVDPLPVNYIIEGNVLKAFWQFNVNPTKITMGYGNIPMHNLYNSSGYLASPFCFKF